MTFSGDDSIELQRFLEEHWMARGRMGEGVTEAERKLRKSLAKYAPYPAASLLAALLTFPQFQENQYRIEFIQLMVLQFCRGKQNLSYKRLDELLNEDCPDHVKLQEDPLEDVYVSTTGDEKGEYLLFEGAFEENAFFLQELLDVLNVRPPPNSAPILEKIRTLLRFSHRTVKECGLDRWTIGLANAKSEVLLPPEKQLRARAKLLTLNHQSSTFNPDDLEKVEPFIEQYTNIDEESFPRYPIIQFRNKKLLLAHPSAISIAARAFAIEQFEANSKLELFQETLRIRRKHYLQEEYFQIKFGIRRTNFVIIPDDILKKNRVDEVLVEYDTKHHAYFVFLHDNLSGFEAKDTYSFVSPPPNVQKRIQERINTITSYCNNNLETEIGIVVIVMCGFGRGISFGINEIPENWHFLPLSLANIDNLRDDGKHSLIQLTRYLREKKHAEKVGIQIGNNLSGFLNEYAYWKSSDYHFIPLDHDTKSNQPLILAIGSDHLTEDRITNRISRNSHYVRYHGDKYFSVSRFEQFPYFKEDKNRPIYISHTAARNAQLLGAIETNEFIIWIQTRSDKAKEETRSFVYNCWRTALYSISRASDLIAEAIRPFNREPIRLFLDFSDFAGDTNFKTFIDGETHPIQIGVSEIELQANVYIPKGLLPHLTKPDNKGEKYFLSAIIDCLSNLLFAHSGIEISDLSRNKILQEIFPNRYARHMHFFLNMSDVEYIVNSSLDPDDLLLVPKSEKSSIHCGLAWSASPNTSEGPIRVKEECNKLLQRASYKLFLSITEVLKKIDTEPLITFLLENIELANLEDTRWSNTSRAVLATHKNTKDTLNTVARIKFRRTEAATISRMLIELALCPMSDTNGQATSQSKLGRLFAQTSEMFSLASQADAIHLNMTKPGVIVCKNGAIHISTEALDQTSYHYLSDSITDSYEIDEKEYEAFYEKQPQEESKTVQDSDPNFSSVFEAEYGMSLSTFRDIFSTFLEIAYEAEQAVISISRDMLETKLSSKHRLPPKILEVFLSRFAFIPRPKWESDDERSNKPWLLQRKYSLTLQPFILLPAWDGKAERILFGIQSIERSLHYVLSSLYNGWQEESVLESPEAKEYIGAVSHEKGRAFEQEVREKTRATGWTATDEVLMRTLGAPESLGDLDTVIWREGDKRVYLAECKRLKFSRTPREIASQLLKFSGDKSKSDDLLGKHLNRLDWLSENTSKFLKHLGIEERDAELIPLIITNRIVPMQYRESMPLQKERFVFVNRLEQFLNTPSRE